LAMKFVKILTPQFMMGVINVNFNVIKTVRFVINLFVKFVY